MLTGGVKMTVNSYESDDRGSKRSLYRGRRKTGMISHHLLTEKDYAVKYSAGMYRLRHGDSSDTGTVGSVSYWTSKEASGDQ